MAADQDQSFRSQDDQTSRFLKTNGPSQNDLQPTPEAVALAQGKSASEAYLILNSSKHGQQNDWLIREVVGLKGAHRIIHSRLSDGDKRFESIEKKAVEEITRHTKEDDERFSKIDATLEVFTSLREKYLTRKQMQRNLMIALGTLFLLPFLAAFAVEYAKKLLKW